MISSTELNVAGRVNGDVFLAHFDTAGIGNDVLVLQRLGDLRRNDAELGHAIALRLDVDHFASLTPEIDFGDVLHEQQFTAQELYVFLEFREAVFRSRYGEENAVDIAKVINDLRLAGARRQLVLNIANLAAYLVPDLRQRIFVVLVLDAHRDRRQAAVRFRLDFL